MCWCGPWNPFLKETQRRFNKRTKLTLKQQIAIRVRILVWGYVQNIQGGSFIVILKLCDVLEISYIKICLLCNVAFHFTFFAKPKVSNLYISLCIQEQIIQLQISAERSIINRFGWFHAPNRGGAELNDSTLLKVLTCTQSYGHVRTVIPIRHRLHKICKITEHAAD